MSCWAQDYKTYCESDADDQLKIKLKHWSEKDFQQETQSEASFLQTFFVDLWGYVSSGSADKTDGYTLFSQFPVERAGQNGGTGKADAAMGWFGETELPSTPQILCEFKDIRSGLDTKQNRKGNDRSPVKQCADYLNFARQQFTPFGNEKIRPVWGVVSDMNEFRLYWKARMPQQYERFVIKRTSSNRLDSQTFLLDTSEKAREKRFLFTRLFHADWLLNRNGTPKLLGLFSAQGEKEKDLEKAFYFEYRAYREDLFKILLASNPVYKQHPRKLVRHTQKLLDRFLFVLFCEDMGAHLQYPVNLLRDLMSEYSQDERYSADEADLWEEKVQRLFKSMRNGTPFHQHQINRFNGGLFAADDELDELHVPNKVFFAPFQGASNESLFKYKKTLLYFAANYNFGIEEGGERAIGLYTLGRIFEQSITDLEIMEAEAAKEVSLMKLSKRKTNGVYYTPEWATTYIVEETLGLRLRELKTELGLVEFEQWTDEQVDADHYKNGKLKKNSETGRYFDLLDTYHENLGNLKVLDPACGSGAFLIQALKRLLQEHEWISSEKSRINYELKQVVVFDIAKAYREILAKNLYGVDVNAESVEITKLALWLHTVMPGQPLSSLDDNILCGNSLVDEQIEEVLGKLSDEQLDRINLFNYQKSFADVFEAGGFDVIIGNPPYIKLQNMRSVQSEATEFWVKATKSDGTPRYKSTQTGNYDIYLPFTEQCIELLNPRGRMGFIQPNVWAVNDYGRGLRELLHESRRMDRWIDFKSFQVFDEAITYTALQFFSGQPTDGIKLHFAPNGGDDLASLDWDQVETLSYDKLPVSDSWQFMQESERLLLEKLKTSSKRLDDPSLTTAIFQGLITSADSIYQLTKLGDNRYLSHSNKSNPVEVEIEDSLMKPLVSGGEAKRYISPETDTYLLFPYDLSAQPPILYAENTLKELFPKGWSYLKHHETELRKREGGKFDTPNWYQFGRNQNIDKQEFDKLIVAQTVPDLRVCFDSEANYYLNNVRVNGIFPKDGKIAGWFLLGIMNAPVANFVFKRIAKVKDGGYYEANKQFIAPLPIPDMSGQGAEQVSQHAETLQSLRTSYRDELQKLRKRISASQLSDDTKSPQWIWADLTNDWKSFKASEEAKATLLKGSALTKWAKAQYESNVVNKLENLAVRMHPKLKLTVLNDDGELSVLADGVPAFDSIYVDESEAEFIVAQWNYVIRTTNITPSLTAKKLLDQFLKLQKTDNESLKKQIIAIAKKLDQLEADIEKEEAEMNSLVYSLYGLSDAEIRQIEQG
ncbi:Eco57I restriction-modification methylase domain-containing protein [Leucothrix mucor]|uniref:Eco57I restriction-modification methylase domain-containing protein n=1 Tax=Leucothrix mucor TaxID=45248 RepID=UPI00040F0B79|nr:DNA methyltransferase [Leucothrix mucor]